jgi:hypothetical protein
MEFISIGHQLRLQPERTSYALEDRILPERFPITVDGRVVRDVIDAGCGSVVVEQDWSRRLYERAGYGSTRP